MLSKLQTALLFCVALGASSIAPAQVSSSNDSPVLVDSASVPRVAVPNLLDPANGEAPLTDSQSQPAKAQASDDAASQQETVRAHGDLTTMVSELRAPEAGTHELDCLATGIYFEAKSEPLAGQLAVGKVIANRAASGGRFPPTYCGVLFQRGQFSFVHGHSLPAVSHSNRQWQTAVAIAKIVDRDLEDSAVGNALFFHARYVSPSWHAKRVASIGNHIFYR
jgi:N-acetylmuramoyl-L-alanine amidase